MIDACENIMVRNGTQKLFKALAKYHYTYAACPVRKMAWGDLAGIKPVIKKRGRPAKQAAAEPPSSSSLVDDITSLLAGMGSDD